MNLDILKDYVKVNGIMLTLRYIVEREEWFGILHIDKTTSIDTYRESLDEVCADLIKKADKRLKGKKEVDKAPIA